MKEYIIQKLTELLIKTDIEDRKKGTDTYVKKTRVYKDLIQILKEYDFRWKIKRYLLIILKQKPKNKLICY